MKIDKSNLGCVIKEVRSNLQITQKDLAEESGLTVNYLSLLENGKRGIGWERLNDLAEIFGIPAELLIFLARDAPDKKDKDAERLLQQIQVLAKQAIAIFVSLRA